MNLKSNIFKIAVLIALIVMLIPAISAEDVDDSVCAESVDVSNDVISQDIDSSADLSADADDGTVIGADDGTEGTDDGGDDNTDEETTGGEDDVDIAVESLSISDLRIAVIAPEEQVHVGDIAQFFIFVYNDGPDTAHNVVVNFALISGDLYLLAIEASQGYYNLDGIWVVGDLAPGEFAILNIVGEVLSTKDLILFASVISDSFDPDESNNLAFGFIDVLPEKEAQAASETLPEAGNPIALAIMALLCVAGVSLRRKL